MDIADPQIAPNTYIDGPLGECILPNIQSALLFHQREVVLSGYFTCLIRYRPTIIFMNLLIVWRLNYCGTWVYLHGFTSKARHASIITK